MSRAGGGEGSTATAETGFSVFGTGRISGLCKKNPQFKNNSQSQSSYSDGILSFVVVVGGIHDGSSRSTSIASHQLLNKSVDDILCGD